MGMSASQARLLSITSRMNDIEFKSQQVANIKMRLAAESEQVASDYTNALNKQKFTFTTYQKEGAVGQAVKISLNSSTLAQVGLKLMRRNPSSSAPVVELSNRPLRAKAVNVAPAASTVNSASALSSARTFSTSEPAALTVNSASALSSTRTFSTSAPAASTVNSASALSSARTFSTSASAALATDSAITANSSWSTVWNNSDLAAELDNSDVQNITSMEFSFTEESDGIPTNFTESQLFEMIESGEFYLADASGKEISVSANTQLAIESDTTDLAKEEAKYNEKTLKINNKEKKLDMEMKALDTEHSALKTEFDSVKQLIGDNIDKSFQLFS